MPGGLILDAVRSERRVAAFAMIGISVSALVLALWPIFPAVLGAQILHAAASCVLNPAIAAISLGLVGHAAVGEAIRPQRALRVDRERSRGGGHGRDRLFPVEPGGLPGHRAIDRSHAHRLAHIPANQIDPVRAHGGLARGRTATTSAALRTLLTNRSLATFAVCVGIFQLANAAMLPLMASIVTMRSSTWATTLVAACIVVPQLAVAAISPTVGRWAQRFGRRPILLLGFGAMPVRGLLFMVVTDPQLLVAVQLLDGICAAVFGVLVPLTIADITRDTGRFNLAQGIVGTGIGNRRVAEARRWPD
jgi:MFS family permease